jgi:sec-independent protein translocase protein TatA
MVLIFLAILLLFGGKKIPELMRGLGKGIREFKDAKDNVKKEIENHINEESPSKNESNS